MLIDLWPGAGAATTGYKAAGFTHVLGVGPASPAEYRGDDYETGDPLRVLAHIVSARGEFMGTPVRFVHASPPPQYVLAIQAMLGALPCASVTLTLPSHRAALGGRVVRLCGSNFGLGVRKHRYAALRGFDVNEFVCRHAEQGTPVGVYGDHPDPSGPVPRPDGSSRGSKARSVAQAARAMGLDDSWTWDELRFSAPPAYTRHLGEAFLRAA